MSKVIGDKKRMAEGVEVANEAKRKRVAERIRALYPELDDFTMGVLVGMDYEVFCKGYVDEDDSAKADA